LTFPALTLARIRFSPGIWGSWKRKIGADAPNIELQDMLAVQQVDLKRDDSSPRSGGALRRLRGRSVYPTAQNGARYCQELLTQEKDISVTHGTGNAVFRVSFSKQSAQMFNTSRSMLKAQHFEVLCCSDQRSPSGSRKTNQFASAYSDSTKPFLLIQHSRAGLKPLIVSWLPPVPLRDLWNRRHAAA